VRLFHGLHRASDDRQLATGEQLYLHVDTRAGKAAPMDPEVRAHLAAICASQASLPVPPEAGRLGARAATGVAAG
jgi:hypothetical protein